MKNVKSLVLLSLLCCLTLQSCFQRGFKLIDKAEQKRSKGKYEKALKLLAKAKNKNYGFDGPGRGRAYTTIHVMRAQVYIDLEEFQLARTHLDSAGCSWSGKEVNLDSIRIRTYQYEFGKDSLSDMVGAALDKTTVVCEGLGCFAYIPLTNGVDMKLKVGCKSKNYWTFREEPDAAERSRMWLEEFRQSGNYQLIKEKG